MMRLTLKCGCRLDADLDAYFANKGKKAVPADADKTPEAADGAAEAEAAAE